VRALHNQRKLSFGVYASRLEAARAADRAGLVVSGKDAVLNMPELMTSEERATLLVVHDVEAYALSSRKAARMEMQLSIRGTVTCHACVSQEVACRMHAVVRLCARAHSASNVACIAPRSS
jgi:hypothetical protein